jgi:hypothetical protein
VNPSGVPYKKLDCLVTAQSNKHEAAYLLSGFTRALADCGLRAFVVIFRFFSDNLTGVAAGYDNKNLSGFNL